MRKLIFLLTLSLLVLSIGCGKQTTAPETSTEPEITVAEIPPEIVQLMQNPAVILEEDGDPIEVLSNDPSANTTIRAHFPTDYNLDGNYAVYQLTFLWGDVFGPPASFVTDWSGSLTMNAIGLVNVTYEIDFENGQDYIIPVDVPTQAAWVSQTQADFDGISFLVFYDMDVFYFAAPTITFETDIFDLTLYVHELEQYASFHIIDENRAVAVHSRRIWHNDCPKGLITGSWDKSENTGNSGNITGFWNDAYGNPLGYVSGQFRTNEDGTRKYSGSVSGLVTDQVIIEFDGNWYYDDYALCPMCGERFGAFKGTFHNIEDNYTGVMKGRFGTPDTPTNPVKMPMIGYWKVDCPYSSVDEFSANHK